MRGRPALAMNDEARVRAIASIRRYAAEQLEMDMGDLKADLLLRHLLEEIGPTIYNQAVAAHVGSVRHLLHVSLSRLEARLDPARFVRVRRTHIVNLDHVRAFRRHGKGGMVAALSDGSRLAVSRSRAQGLRGLAS